MILRWNCDFGLNCVGNDGENVENRSDSMIKDHAGQSEI
jgi:hypothetical protein